MVNSVEKPITRREVYDKLQDLEVRLTKKIDDLGDKIDALGVSLRGSFVPQSDHENLKARVKSLESTLAWAARLVVGAVILGLIGLLVSGG